MKNIILIILLFLALTSTFAQSPNFDVRGDAKITGRLELLKGNGNTLVGFEAGKMMNALAHSNTYFGYQAGFSDTVGHENAFFGYQAGYNNLGVTSSRNSFIGHRAGYTNESGFDNCFVGYKAGEATLNDRNVFVGAYTGITNSSGEKNTYIGTAAGEFGNGSENIMIGTWAGRNNSRSKNCLIGTQAGFSNNGSSNVFLGYQAGFSELGSNLLYIENSDSSTPLIWGDFLNNDVMINGDLCYSGTFGVCSDLRFKKNIMVISDALFRLLNIKGIEHNWRHEEFSDMIWKKGKEYGVVAQDVEIEFPHLVNEDKDGYKYVDYVKFAPIFIEAIRQQQTIIEELQDTLDQLKQVALKTEAELASIKSLLDKLSITKNDLPGKN